MTDLPNTTATTDISLIDNKDNTENDKPHERLNDKRNFISAVCYKPSVGGDTQKEGHRTVEKTGRKLLEHN